MLSSTIPAKPTIWSHPREGTCDLEENHGSFPNRSASVVQTILTWLYIIIYYIYNIIYNISIDSTVPVPSNECFVDVKCNNMQEILLRSQFLHCWMLSKTSFSQDKQDLARYCKDHCNCDEPSPPNHPNLGEGAQAIGDVCEFDVQKLRQVARKAPIFRQDIANSCKHCYSA